ncbi:MAG TPA: YihY/virulence factor BrkB family protein [Acidimicrobiia bacterium]|nr:YihY/virulence factor BrkB family protein [Acidimicrobiia bacterium]
MRIVDEVSDRIDAYQRRHPVLGFPHAVQKRHGEEYSGRLGAVISYYAVFALLPLLLAFVTVLRTVFGDNDDLRDRVLDAVWEQLPFVGPDIREGVEPLAGSAWIVIASLLVTLWGARRVAQASQDAINQMWGVPLYARPGFFPKIARTFAVFALLGCATFGTSAIAGLTLGKSLGPVMAVATTLASIALSTLVMAALYFLLCSRRLTLRELAPGSVFAGVAVYLLTLLGGVYVQRVVAEASSLYGSFAAIVGLLAWITLLVQAFVYGNLINVVRVEQLWPRTLTGRNLGDADVRAVELTKRRDVLVSQDRLDQVLDRDASAER